MTDRLRAAMQSALQVLMTEPLASDAADKAEEILRAALAEPEVEPVAIRVRELECVISDLTAECKSLRNLLHELVAIEGPQPGTAAWADKVLDALAGTTTPRREWVSLTDEEVERLTEKTFWPDEFARAIEAALKERNT